MADTITAIVNADEVAVRAGLPLPLDATARAVIEEAIEDAYAEAAAHLRRPPLPETFTQKGVRADGRGGWLLNYDPVVEVLKVEPETIASDPAWEYSPPRYTITYRAGLDPATDPRYGRVLARYLKWAAANSPLVRRLAQTVPGSRLIASVNIEGQGVSYENAATGQDAAGAPPTLASLDEWVRPIVYQAPDLGPHPIETGMAWQF
ncbi:hypothetical protein ETD86_12985 [Nonomuraea turkmeniaca]|uniref:Uncharacterized protein n=1 Tax=Nonomuraea turkmeniaca TaxID=103838 RepID=A0A5S4FMX1_9ACTN|nr:hypothetical protein [Nonomuraea turkmeniaca]TMR22077.1 hypothetical protein ETD86_12985 [Nonomuraea turkmeniaca]